MTYIQHYDAPLGRILLAADEVGLTGLWFDGAKYFADGLPAEHTERETPVLSEARRWLDLYFAGQEPGFLPPLHPAGSAFQQAVWALLLQIPYGQTVPTVNSRGSLRKSREGPGCLRRPWAALSGITKFLLSFRAIAWSAPAAA